MEVEDSWINWVSFLEYPKSFLSSPKIKTIVQPTMRILLAAIYPYAFLLLYLIIPFDNYIRALPNILLGILVVAFPFIVKKEDFKKLRSLPIALFLAFFVFLCINSFVTGRTEDFNIIKKVMIAVGLAVLYIPISNVDKIKNAIIFSALAAIIFSVYNFVLISDATGNFSLGESPIVVESLLIDRLYLGLLCVFSILISVQGIKTRFHPYNNYYLANILINAVFIILIASKIALVALFVVLIARQFYGKPKIRKITIAVGAVVAIVGLLLLMKNENEHRNSTDGKPGFSIAFIENSMTYELRAVVWECSAKIMENEGFLINGMGFSATNDKLVTCYGNHISDPDKNKEFVENRYHTHNQFLDFYLSAGFIALLLFGGFVIVSFLSVRKHFFSTAMLAILVLYCLVENVFHRQIGAYYIGFILIVIMTGSNYIENNRIKEA